MVRLKQEKFNGEITPAIVDFVKELVRAKLRKKPIPNLEIDDAVQEALEKTLIHLPKFDPKKCSLPGYLSVIVQSVLRQRWKYHTAAKRYNGPVLTMELAESYCPFDVSFMDRNYATVRFKTDLFHHAPLGDEEAQVVKMLYYGLSRREIARALNIPRSRLDWTIKTIGQKYLHGVYYGTELQPRN